MVSSSYTLKSTAQNLGSVNVFMFTKYIANSNVLKYDYNLTAFCFSIFSNAKLLAAFSSFSHASSEIILIDFVTISVTIFVMYSLVIFNQFNEPFLNKIK